VIVVFVVVNLIFKVELTDGVIMFSRFSRIAATLLIALSLASCATMSPEECRVANWNDVGMRDGLEGKTLALLSTRASDCAESGVRIDNAAYMRGREAGLRNYCRLENAVPLGLNGGNYEGVCPPQIDGEFRLRYQLGHNVYATSAEVGRIESRMESQENRLRKLDRDEDKRVHNADSEDERRRIRRDTDNERRHIRDELRDLDRNLRQARDNQRYAEWALSGGR
jgi:hypothetical protein